MGRLVAVAAIAAGCGTAPSTGLSPSFDFSQGPQGWLAGLSDYHPAELDTIQFVADYRRLPPPLNTSSSALFLSSLNSSADAFMYYKVRFPGLMPGVSYTVTFDAEIASDVGTGCTGIGGSPGEGVTFKAGVFQTEPMAVLNASGEYVMNLDKGNQVNSGANGLALGDIATAAPCLAAGNGTDWQVKRLSRPQAIQVVAANDGSVWLFAGTDSGFEGVTSIYITKFAAAFTRQ